MPTNLAIETLRSAARSPSGRQLPVGVGLAVGASVSVGLWTLMAFGLRVLMS